MNDLKKLNRIAISIPFVISLFAIFETGFLLLALISTMITGLLQIIIAFIFLYRKTSTLILIYLALVIIFFINLVLNDFESIKYIVILPVFLVIYLTLILNTEPTNKK